MLQVNSSEWAEIETAGAAPRPRVGHMACLAADKLFVFGGRDAVSTVADMYILNIPNLAWEQLSLDSSPESPLPLYGGCCHAVKTATSYKVYYCLDLYSLIPHRRYLHSEVKVAYLSTIQRSIVLMLHS